MVAARDENSRRAASETSGIVLGYGCRSRFEVVYASDIIRPVLSDDACGGVRSRW
jgi:hypothetical protein